jgi:hypothetical protein
MAGAQVALDDSALALVPGQEMDVNLVGAELGAAMADLSEIERSKFVVGTPDAQGRATPAGFAPNQNVIGPRQLGALDKTEDGMHVLLAGGAAPKLERPGRTFPAYISRRPAPVEVAERHNTRKLDDTRTHNS